MARSDLILERLRALHPKLIDLSLDRIERLLSLLGNPERALPAVVHVAGTNGKGSVIAFMRAAMEASGLLVHTYTSPHLVSFHERIRLAKSGGGVLIGEAELTAILEECETVNGGAAITEFEITTAAALVAFARHPADAVVLETGLGGRLDATNVVERPALTVITTIDLDHQDFLGDTMTRIAGEKAGILKPGVTCILGPQNVDALDAIERRAAIVGAPLVIHGQDWQAYEEHGRLVYQDTGGLLDLPLPRLSGRFQIGNAGTAIAALRALEDFSFTEQNIETGLLDAEWPARLARLTAGPLVELAPADAEIWLDGGHNPAAAEAIATSLAELEDRVPRPLVLIMGMLNTKDPAGFMRPFSGLAQKIIAVGIPGEKNAISPEVLADIAEAQGFLAEPAETFSAALGLTSLDPRVPPRILICGSLYLAGHVLAANAGS